MNGSIAMSLPFDFGTVNSAAISGQLDAPTTPLRAHRYGHRHAASIGGISAPSNGNLLVGSLVHVKT